MLVEEGHDLFNLSSVKPRWNRIVGRRGDDFFWSEMCQCIQQLQELHYLSHPFFLRDALYDLWNIIRAIG